ncbi:MAG: type I methionyl aminopeptidase [Candidatus Taylorbacteria bacterium RIFCSPHIGHO2_02_FULL_46_13]|uniref:Methionine aminopeptidase n=1 Tax=Candidatus Taylorbacteria bacterium RIFCSPHIGHO2_02_FULL_46_13 TaxID=1802312 RepID=A0A1G2MPZ3_9BACT|nr:MAG: type I methionyl aminopeptidase [Candidatus Taylorbacteria bacterium RIFCSPHIGHO2_02_FULL_46_13]
MITIKTTEEINLLREGGWRLAEILAEVARLVKPGVTGKELDMLAEKLIREGGDVPSFLNYRSRGKGVAYPASLCVSVNDQVVHGLPTGTQIIKAGDVVSLDLGLIHQGLFLDSALTLGVGKIDTIAQKLIGTTRESLSIGIAHVVAGKHVGDIGYAIERFIKPHGFGIVRELAGHGVGYEVHEDPYIPNYGKRGAGAELKKGMVVAIEPMINEGGDEIFLDKDGFTYRTRDGKRSAHFEHTVLITDGEPEILTQA